MKNDVPELKSRLEYATGRRQPIKTTAKRLGATHVKPMASKPSVYGQQIAPTAQFAPQHNIAPQPPTYGQQRTTNATPITSLPSQQVAPAQPSLYGNQRPSTPSIVSQQAPPLITSQQAPPPIGSQQAPSIQAMQQAAYGTSGSSTFLPAAQAATASMPAKPVFQPTVPVPMAPQALPTSGLALSIILDQWINYFRFLLCLLPWTKNRVLIRNFFVSDITVKLELLHRRLSNTACVRIPSCLIRFLYL